MYESITVRTTNNPNTTPKRKQKQKKTSQKMKKTKFLEPKQAETKQTEKSESSKHLEKVVTDSEFVSPEDDIVTYPIEKALNLKVKVIQKR